MRALGADQGRAAPDTAVIQIWLGGGPSQFETFDPKPLAPVEIRGPYRAIPSKLPGALVCEMMPLRDYASPGSRVYAVCVTRLT